MLYLDHKNVLKMNTLDSIWKQHSKQYLFPVLAQSNFQQ